MQISSFQLRELSKKKQIKDSFILIDGIAKRYGKLPSEILFPDEENKNFALAIDNLIYQAGIKEELELEYKKEKAKMENDSSITMLLVKALSR